MISLDNIFNEEIPIYSKSNENFRDSFEDIVKINKELHYEFSKSTEGVIGKTIVWAFKMIGQIIVFIGKAIAWITKTVLNKIASFIAWLTRSKKKPAPEKSKGLLSKLKSKFGRSAEDDHQDKDTSDSLSSYIQKCLKTEDEVKKMKPEEVVFYKAFLINGNPDNIKYISDAFNKQTSVLKNNAVRIDKEGSSLIAKSNIDTSKHNVQNEEDWWLFSLEAEEPNDKPNFIKLGDVLVKDHKVNTSINIKRDYENILNSIYRSIYDNPDDSVWLKRLQNIFSNGSNELKSISSSMKKKQEYLEKLNKDKLSDDMKNKINTYGKLVQGFQPSIMSYVSCINYFTKYQSIRMNIIRRFTSLAA